jgi:hypothetical protein
MKRLNTTRATLGELLNFIGNSLIEKILSQMIEAELIETFAAFFRASRGDVRVRPSKL